MSGPAAFIVPDKLAIPFRGRANGFTYILVLVWVLSWYRETAWAMVDIWRQSDTFMHCFLIPPIVIWLVWRQRAVLAREPSRPDWRMLVLIAIAGGCWLIGEVAAVNAITQVALVSILVLAVPTLFGGRIARTIAFPLGFLFFCAPIGDFVLPTMMEWTANFTVFALRLSGVPVYREGLQFVLPTGNWSVVQACSGIRYLIASITVGSLFAYLSYRSLKRRLAFVAVAILVPVVANWLRAYGIVMLGHLSNNRLATGVDHIIYGWLFFGVVIMLMFLIGGRWADVTPEAPSSRSFDGVESVDGGRSSWPMAVATMIVVCLPPLGNSLLQYSANDAAPQVHVLLQPNLSWHQAAAPADWHPSFENPSSEMQVGYVSPAGNVGLYIGYYRHQGYTRKLVSSENVLVNKKDPVWSLAAAGRRQIIFNGHSVMADTAELRGNDLAGSAAERRLIAWKWYWINGYSTSNEYLAKARIALLRLMGQGDDSAVIIVYTPKVAAGIGEGILQKFLQDAGPSVESALGRAREHP